jgi:3-oxoacyl-[acyl-carrier-protein] synthase II
MNELRIAIEGIGVVGGFGSGAEALRSALHKGYAAPSRVSVEMDDGPRELSLYRADTSRLEEFFQKRELRRIDHYSRMTLLAASMALKDAGLPVTENLSTGIIVATGYGPHRTTFSFLDSFIKDGDTFSSPTQFASSVHNAAAAYLAILLKEKGPSLTVSQFDMSVASALMTAACWLQEGRVDRVLFGAVDEYSDVLGYCWHRLFGEEAAPEMIRPLDFESQTAIPGEGSAFFVLSLTKDAAMARHGFVAPIFSGFPPGDKRFMPSGQAIIMGADGRRDTGRLYAETVREMTDIRCFTTLYGSMPVGQAFDMAIAALQPEEEGPTFCVKFSGPGELGVISVSPAACRKG